MQVSTFAGTGIPGVVDGPAATAQFHAPKGMAFDAQGNMLVAEAFKCLIRKVSTTGLVSTVAGTGVCGYLDGPVATAQFQNPQNLEIDPQGFIFLTDNRSIRKISPDGIVSTLAGTGVLGFADGPGATAQFENVGGLTLDSSGNLFVTERTRIRKVTPEGFVSTLAGTGSAGYQDGSGLVAQFQSLGDIDLDRAGNLYVADTVNNRIRKVSQTGMVSTVGGNGNPGFADGPSDSAQFVYPSDVVVDGAGNLFITDSFNYRVRKIAVTGIVSTLAGSGTAGFLDGDALTAQFWLPLGLEMDSLGNLYVTEAGTTLADPYRRIRKISTPGIPFGTNSGTSTTTTTTTIPSVPGVLGAKIVRLSNSPAGDSVYSVTLKMSGVPSGTDYEFVVPSGHVPPDPPNDPQTQRHVERAVSGVVQWQYNVTNPRGIFTARLYVLGANSPLSSVEVK